MEDNVEQAELTAEEKMLMARAGAVQEAMLEVMREQQPEIIRRAALRLKAMGIIVDDEVADGANI